MRRLAFRRCLFGAAVLAAGCSLSAPSVDQYAKARPAGVAGSLDSSGTSSVSGDSGSDAGGTAATHGGAGKGGAGTGAVAGAATGGGGSSNVTAGSGSVIGAAGDGGASGATSSGVSLGFQGSQLLTVAPSVTDDFTIELWLKTELFGPGQDWYDGAALFDADQSLVRNDFGATLVGSSFAFGTGNPDTTIVSKTMVDTGVWMHVAATRVKSTGVISIYVNGVLETSQATGNMNSLTDATAPSIGGLYAESKFSRGFFGTLSDLRLWNIARKQADIASTMKRRLHGNEAGLVGYWRLDDGAGTVAKDSSSSHNDGSLGGGNALFVPKWVNDAPELAPAP